jgi:hypothetical protein
MTTLIIDKTGKYETEYSTIQSDEFEDFIGIWMDDVIVAGCFLYFMRGWSESSVREYVKEMNWKIESEVKS